MPQDYFLRLVEQVGQMLGTILRLRKQGRDREAVEQIAVQCRELTGLPVEVVKRSSPANLVDLLASGGATRYIREIMLAELLMQDAELSDATGKSREALVSRLQARALLVDAIPHVGEDEASSYQTKLNSLEGLLSAVK